MYNEKYLYIRTRSVLSSDDDNRSSALVPVSNLRGAWNVDGTSFFLTWHSLHDVKKNGGATRDYVVVFHNTGKMPDILEVLYREIATGENPMIVLGDDVTSEYLSSEITSIGTIAVSVDEV
tara:strand:- start:7395 stop:7757 length:363 start_codon:yes stop_codon:yes gene_type:complete